MSEVKRIVNEIPDDELDKVTGGSSDNQIIRWVCPNCSEKMYESWPIGQTPATVFCQYCQQTFASGDVGFKRCN